MLKDNQSHAISDYLISPGPAGLAENVLPEDAVPVAPLEITNFLPSIFAAHIRMSTDYANRTLSIDDLFNSHNRCRDFSPTGIDQIPPH